MKRQLATFLITTTSFFGFGLEYNTLNEDAAYRYLDEIALESGTDKSSSFHNYTKIYATYLEKYQASPIKFLEIGIQYGYSAKLWEKYFKEAELHFFDIDLNQVIFNSPRCHYHKVDQTDSSGLIKLAHDVGGNFDIILDDGGHRMDQILITFKSLFPFLKKGGLYIIEDTHTSYWFSHGGYGTLDKPQSGPDTAIQFFKNLIDDLNYTAARTACAGKMVPPNIEEELSLYQKDIKSIHFYKGLCIIIKRD